MTKVFYRVGDKVITSFAEYLKIKNSVEPAYMFLVECIDKDVSYDTFEEYQKYHKVIIPKRMN